MNYFSDWYLGHWTLVVFVALLIYVVIKPRQMTIIGYCLASSAAVGFAGYQSADPSVMVQIRLAALQGFVQMGFLYFIYKTWRDGATNLMRWVFWINLELTLACWVWPMGFNGLGLNTSLNGTLIALLLGYEIGHHKTSRAIIVMIISLIVVGLTKTSMGLLAIVIGSSFAFVATRGVPWWQVVPMLGLTFGGAYYRYGPKLWSLTHRDEMWALMLQYMKEQNTWILGSGYGTFSYLGPAIQDAAKWTKVGYFVQAHSSFIQILFEGGVIGLALWVGTLTIGIYRSVKIRSLGQTYFFVALAVSCVGNFPLRLPLTVICIAGMLNLLTTTKKVGV